MEDIKNKLEKTCFIITPIGGESEPIRRRIDGIIDTVIEPLINEKGYELIVAHRINMTGSINKQVISSIYTSDLVIANLTNLNPNVMYELAFAHSIGKPTVTIAEAGTTKLPFDIATERTIFYRNDFMGVTELKRDICNIIDTIESNPNTDDIDNPIYTWLDKSVYENKLVKAIESKNSKQDIVESDALKYIIDRLDRLESKFDSNKLSLNLKKKKGTFRAFLDKGYDNFSSEQREKFYNEILERIKSYQGIEFIGVTIGISENLAKFDCYLDNDKELIAEILADIIDSAYNIADKYKKNN